MFAGAVQTLISTPVDLLKIRQQLQLVPPGSPLYVGPLQLLRHIIRHEGLPGDYVIMTVANLKHAIPLRLHAPQIDCLPYLHLSSQKRSTPLLHAHHSVHVCHKPMHEGLHKHVTPEEVSLWLHSGLYRGAGITLLRDVPAHAIYFTSYEACHELFAPGSRASGEQTAAVQLLGGGLAGVLSWLGIYHFDVVKTRLQSHPRASSPYSGALCACVPIPVPLHVSVPTPCTWFIEFTTPRGSSCASCR